MGDKIGGDPTGQSFLNYLKNVAGQDVFMGYQMNISQVPSNQPTLSHVTNVFSRFMSYDGKSFNYVSGWVSAFGTAGNG
jgi:DNA-binding protein Fis